MHHQVVLIEDVFRAVLAIEQPGTIMGLLRQLRRVAETPVGVQLVNRLRGMARQMVERDDQEPERLTFPAGWCPTVQKLLRRAGMSYEHQNAAAQLPGGLSAADVAKEHQPFVQALSKGARGQIVLESRNELPGHLVVLYRYLAKRPAFPLRNMLVCCISNREKWPLSRELKSVVPPSIDVFKEVQELERQGGQPKIFVANEAEFVAAASNPDAWDVFVVIGGDVALHERVGKALEQRLNTPRYCFRFANEKQYDLNKLTIAERFGKKLYAVSANSTQLLKIPFNAGQSQQSPKTVRLRDGREAAEYKRQQLWNNQGRNELVAKIAKAIVNRDPRQLRNLGVEIDDALRERVLKGATVSVVVENDEHGQALLALLPGWKLKQGTLDHGRWPEEWEALKAEYRRRDEKEVEVEVEIVATAMDRCIATETRLEKQRLDTDIVIRASGAPEILDNRFRFLDQRHLMKWLLDLEEPRIRRKADPAIRPKVM